MDVKNETRNDTLIFNLPHAKDEIIATNEDYHIYAS